MPNSVRMIVDDVRTELRDRPKLPPGPTSFSLARTHRFIHDPLPMLLEYYERYGSVFAVRFFHRAGIFMLGPEANHFITATARATWGT